MNENKQEGLMWLVLLLKSVLFLRGRSFSLRCIPSAGSCRIPTRPTMIIWPDTVGSWFPKAAFFSCGCCSFRIARQKGRISLTGCWVCSSPLSYICNDNFNQTTNNDTCSSSSDRCAIRFKMGPKTYVLLQEIYHSGIENTRASFGRKSSPFHSMTKITPARCCRTTPNFSEVERLHDHL